MEPKIEPWMKEAAKAILHAGSWPDEWEPEDVDEIAAILAQHAPSSPAAHSSKLCELCAPRDAAAMRALESLTPSGSEFVNDVERCVQFARAHSASQMRAIVQLTKRVRELDGTAPTPHMTAAEFYREVWIKENGSDPRGDWPIRMAEAYAASETARADQFKKLSDQSTKHCVQLSADLQRKDAAARALISEIEQDFCNLCAKDEGDAHKTWCPIVQLKAALGSYLCSAAPEGTTPSPCCANPNMVVKGVCDKGTISLHEHNRDKARNFVRCENWRPTHNVCLNCGEEEKL